MNTKPAPKKKPAADGPKKRGRPPRGAKAMTSSERQSGYRKRLKSALFETDPMEMTRVTVMQQLTAAVIALENEAYELAEGAQSIAEQMVAEIVARCDLDLARVRKLAKASAERREAQQRAEQAATQSK